MIELPTPERMASLVSNVTQTMLGISFDAVEAGPQSALHWRTALLGIAGQFPLTVGLSSDERGCRKLSAAMFSCPDANVDQGMMNDALCELVNMTAGLLKGALSLDQSLGLPKVVPDDDPRFARTQTDRQVIVLRAREVGLMLWVLPGVA
ncbi:MAG TPA: chemotaxis protein CheX [Myxococcales bacterium]|nr:chemotaxis protein CheX [Myxococcales bacterium]